MTTTAIDKPTAVPASAERVPAQRPRLRPARVALHAFLATTALVWLVPLLWAAYTSFRPYADTAARGYVSLPGVLSLENYANAWQQAELPHFFWNTMIVTVPAVIMTLLLASFIAFAVSRFSWKFNISLLMLFTAGNLLPQQVIISPLFRLYLLLRLPEWLSSNGVFFDSYFGIIAINVAFQVGFCTFVLANYMKTIPMELTEAALVDGASVWRQYWRVILPLSRPALAALATLEFTWIYNDFFWALVLMQTGAKRPITSALALLQGQFFTDNNKIAAASLMIAVPTLTVYFLLQRHFVKGLTLGSTKG